MLGHTRKHRTKEQDISSSPLKEKEKDFILWREASKERIEQYTEPGIMLRGSRYKNEMTQQQLADKLRIKRHHISEMEHGKRPIGKNMAKRLSEILHVDYRIFL